MAFEPIADIFCENIPPCSALNAHFEAINHNNLPLHFFKQDEKLPYSQLGYEERIFEQGIIATRENNWHDYLNALVWHKFSKTKSTLNALHYSEIQQQQSSLRSKKRDLLTLFDECGVIVMAGDKILELIREHRWHELFIDNRQLWLDKSIKITTFGHAMYEKYLSPYIGMTAKALLIPATDISLDTFISSQLLQGNLLQEKTELAPLPVLGIPNWHPFQDATFYANQQYFRGI